MPSEDNQTTNDEENKPTVDDSQSSENSENKEDESKEDEEPIFHPHRGKIMQILPYKRLSSLSYDKSYTEPTSTGKAEIIFSTYDYPFIYKGVSCKLKVRRDTDRQFSATGIEEVYSNDEDIKIREHYPTEEQRLESTLSTPQKEFANKDYSDFDVESTVVSRSASDDGLYGFVTDVSHTQESTELSLKDWGYCLEDITKELEFNGMLRSQIMEEVTKSFGLVPIIDFEGLEDDVVMSWSNKKTTGNAKSNESEEQEVGNPSGEWDDCSSIKELADEYGPRSGPAGHIPEEDSKYTATIGKTGTNYAEFVKGCTTPEAVMKKLRTKMKYRRYSDNDPKLKCASGAFDAMDSQGINCGDSSRLVKCCMDVCGIPCMCVHTPGHYYNAVKKGNKWYTTDLCRIHNIKAKKETQTLGV